MAKNYNYATRYETEIQDILRQDALTSQLETPAVNWLGAKSFAIKTLKTSGYKPHIRDLGWNTGTIEDDEHIYTLGFDRDIQFFVDQMDVDETNRTLTAGNVTGQFMRENAVPEIDAYRFSKIASKAIELRQTSATLLTTTNIYDELKKAILPIRKYGASNMVIYMSSASMDLLERSEYFGRSISTEKIANIETRVTSLDGVKLVEVWDSDRFKTVFDFSEGFIATEESKDINFLVVAKSSIIAKTKLSSIYLFAPGEHTEGDGWLYQNRMYHDLFVDKLKTDGIFVSIRSD